MTIKKIADIPRPCSHPEHEPPKYIVLQPGIYEHRCPACGAKRIITVGHVGL